MHILEGGQVTMFDVDDTIIMWRWPDDGTPEKWIYLKPWGEDGGEVKLAVNQEMVEQIKRHSARGHRVVVWSLGGWQWTKTVVEKLELQQYVALVMEKPTWIYDDKRPQDFMPMAQWVGRKEWLERDKDGK